MSNIFFTALGGAEEVGRSSFVLDYGEKILLDRGVKLSSEVTEYPLPVTTNLDAVIISHAHLDHSGNLPHLFLESRFMCYMTISTLDLSKLLWFDSLKIARLEAMEPEWTKDEIARTEKYSFPTNYRKRVQITEQATLEFFDAGHILGSAMSLLDLGDKKVVYTGDYKLLETRLHNGADLNIHGTDYLIIESTYGDRNHPPRKETEKLFIEAVQDTLDKGGWVLVPSFAVGRSQEIIDILAEHKVNAPVFFDGMCQKAAKIMLDHPNMLKNPGFLKKALNKAVWVKGHSFRKKALKQPSVIVSSAGMLAGGPILHYLKEVYSDKNSSVLMTGFQVPGTPGRMLLETGKIDVDGTTLDVKARVEKFDFSAHADQTEMIQTVKKLSPKKVLLVHGDKEVIPVFQSKILEETGIETVVPRAGEKIKL
ncbi:MAG: MBL fold metallo-hydrolase [Candidatus Diapherotrites archaeon]|nr:MBL fold metallo-hydrolase [Candidatus Diapherotrites archaeon]